MTYPVISVVMACYNAESTIRQAIESILVQTYKHFELIIVDDGSTDSSRQIIEEYARQDKRIIADFSDHTGSVSKVVNKGFKKAGGKYYCTVDADDYIRQDCFALSLDFIEKHNPKGMIYTYHTIIDENDRSYGIPDRCRIKYSKAILLLNFITFHFRLFHRDLYYRVGKYDESISTAVDYDFCLRVSEIADIKQLKEPLYFYRVHKSQISTKNKPHQQASTGKAIINAMQRRGLDKTYRLVTKKVKTNNKIITIFRIVKKGGVYIF